MAGPLFAHDTWLTPESRSVPPGSVVRLDLTSGMAFPDLDHPIDADRVERASCRLGGKTFEIAQRQKRDNSLVLTAHLVSAGVATLWVDLKSKAIELEPEQVGEYFDEIGAPEELRKSWDSTGGRIPWRELYTKHSKTFVRVGKPGVDGSWAEPAGQALEFVPEQDPTMVRVGNEFSLRVLKRGIPLPGSSVGVVRAGRATGKLLRTDAKGRVAVRPDRAALLSSSSSERRSHRTVLQACC